MFVVSVGCQLQIGSVLSVVRFPRTSTQDTSPSVRVEARCNPNALGVEKQSLSVLVSNA